MLSDVEEIRLLLLAGEKASGSVVKAPTSELVMGGTMLKAPRDSKSPIARTELLPPQRALPCLRTSWTVSDFGLNSTVWGRTCL